MIKHSIFSLYLNYFKSFKGHLSLLYHCTDPQEIPFLYLFLCLIYYFNLLNKKMFANKNCVPCQGGIPPLDKSQILRYNKLISDDWFVVDEKKLVKNFVFSTFNQAIFFSNKVAELATLEGHHPYIHINFKTVKINF